MPGKKHIDRPARSPGFRFTFWEMIGFIIALTGFGAGCIYLDIRSKRGELTARQMDLNDILGQLEESRKRVESRRSEVGKLQEKMNLLESLEQEKSALGTQVPDAERQLASWRAQLATAVGEERSKAVGTMHPELRLVDGAVLTDVRIMSVADTEMSVAHAGGVARVPAKRLPPEFQERYRFGMDLTDATGTTQVPSSATTISRMAEAGYLRLTASQRKQVDTLNADLTAKKARLLLLEKKARESEAGRPARPEVSKPPENSEQVRIQMERDKQRKAVDQHVRSAEITARTREMNALQKEIAAIEAGIRMIYQGGQ